MKLLLGILAIVALTLAAEKYAPTYERMDNHLLVSVSISTQKHLDILVDMEAKQKIDVWSRESSLGFGSNEIHVTPEVFDAIKKLGVGYHVVHNNIQELFDDELAGYKYVEPNATAQDWFQSYHDFNTHRARCISIVGSYGDATLSKVNLGTTNGGRELFAMKLSNGGSGKTTFFNTGGLHAREWIGPQTVQYIMETFANNYASGSAAEKAILDKMDITWMPLSNPDGYEYSWTNVRLWRKSRAPTSNPSCPGTDLNRNFDSHWGEGGGSTNPCSDTYQGARVASELETQAVSKYFRDNQPTGFGIDWHAYSQLILRPWGWTSSLSACESKCAATGNAMREAIRAESGKSYTSQRSIQLYKTTGTASDYYYDASTISPSQSQGFTFELRPASSFPGFQLPASEILPTGRENYQAFLVAANSVA